MPSSERRGQWAITKYKTGDASSLDLDPVVMVSSEEQILHTTNNTNINTINTIKTDIDPRYQHNG